MKTQHWTEDFIDRIRIVEAMYEIAYKALIYFDGSGECCHPNKPGMHTDNCVVVRAISDLKNLEESK